MLASRTRASSKGAGTRQIERAPQHRNSDDAPAGRPRFDDHRPYTGGSGPDAGPGAGGTDAGFARDGTDDRAGRGENDTFLGGAGRGTLVGAGGSDRLAGGEGADIPAGGVASGVSRGRGDRIPAFRGAAGLLGRRAARDLRLRFEGTACRPRLGRDGPSEPVVQTAPGAESLAVVAKADPAYVGWVRAGQRAVLSLTAFLQRATPETGTTVRPIAADRVSDERTGASYSDIPAGPGRSTSRGSRTRGSCPT